MSKGCNGGEIAEYMGTKEAAKLWNMSQVYVGRLCREGKIEGAEQDGEGSPWRIPVNAKNPKKRND